MHRSARHARTLARIVPIFVGAANSLDAYVLDAPVLLALGRSLRGLLIIRVPWTSISSFLPRLRRLQM